MVNRIQRRKDIEDFHKYFTYREVKGEKNTYEIVKKDDTKRKFLTRGEIWEAIKSKYHNMKRFNIEAPWKEWSWYVTRTDLFNLMIEMKIHKSRHLTKKQKMKVQEELKLNEMNKILRKL